LGQPYTQTGLAPVNYWPVGPCWSVGFNPNNGLNDLYTKMPKMSASDKTAIEACLESCYKKRPGLAMVDSARGITNLHVPSDVIIDASMP